MKVSHFLKVILKPQIITLVTGMEIMVMIINISLIIKTRIETEMKSCQLLILLEL